MAATLVVTLQSSNFSIDDLNNRVSNATNTNESINLLMNLLSGMAMGNYSGTIQIITVDNTPTIALSGVDSTDTTLLTT